MELIVKQTKGNLTLDPHPVAWWNEHVKRTGFMVLPLRQNHVERLWTLPLIHRDPADRLLNAQALAEGIPLVSSDTTIGQYQLEVVW